MLDLPAFAWRTYLSARQLERTAGFLGGTIFADLSTRTFWTSTVWTDMAAMRGYRDSGAHRRTMPRLLDWCDEAAVAHWEKMDAQPPTAAEVLAGMLATGRVSKVRHPSAAHAAGQLVGDGHPPVGRQLHFRPGN